jgi:hypothetical protein
MAPEISITQRCYDWITEHRTGHRFTCKEAAQSLSESRNAVSGSLNRLEKFGVLAVVGSIKQGTYVYEYVSHEPMKFKMRMPGGVGGRHCPKRVKKGRLPIIKSKSLSEQLMDIAIDLEGFIPIDRILDIAEQVEQLEVSRDQATSRHRSERRQRCDIRQHHTQA